MITGRPGAGLAHLPHPDKRKAHDVANDTTRALEIARQLAAAGIPVFVARFAGWGEGSGKRAATDTHPGKPGIGFWLPKNWQHSPADPSVVDSWAPGDALCMVTGRGIDVIDIDSYKGEPNVLASRLLAVSAPLGQATTPSAGTHIFTPPLNVGTTQLTDAHIDIKSGRADGSGRGYVFLAPTAKLSRTTGNVAGYAWGTEPELAGMTAPVDHAAFAALIGERPAAARVEGEASGALSAFLRQKPPARASAAMAAVTTKLTEIGTAPMAGFRTVLMGGALLCGGYVAGGLFPRAVAEQMLIDAVTVAFPGGPDPDDLLWIDQGLTDGEERKPLPVVADDTTEGQLRANEAAGRGQWSVFSTIDPSPLELYSELDQERAEAVWSRLWPALRYATDAGAFVSRDWDRWELRPSAAKSAVYLASHLLPPGSPPDPELAKNRAEWTEENWRYLHWAAFRKSTTASAIADKLVAAVALNGHYASLRVADLDTDPDILWAGGVPFDLRAGEGLQIAQIDPNTPHLMTAAVVPDRRPTPAWDAYTAVVWPDPEVRSWVMRVFAVAFTGHPAAVLPILHGRERSGKSTFVERLVRLLGTYGVAANKKLLGDSEGHDTVVYALKGARLAFLDEGPRRGHAAEERLKQLTGGGSLTGRPMRANEVTFHASHTLAMTMNGDPEIGDPALRARIRPVPCDAPEADVRPAVERLIASWADEAPGIMAGFISEAGRWLADRVRGTVADGPEVIRLAEAAMADSQNVYAEWVAECCVPDGEGTAGRELHRSFAAWWDRQVIHRRKTVPSETAFGRGLTDLGYRPVQRGKYWFRPLRVITPGQYGQNDPVRGLRGYDAASGDNPRTPITPGQTPNLDSFLADTRDNLPYKSQEKNDIYGVTNIANGVVDKYSRENRGEKPAGRVGTPPNGSVDQAKQGGAGLGAEPAPFQDQLEKPANKPYEYKTTKTDKGNISQDKKLVAQRNREETRLLAITEAAGATVTLPVLVDRAGRIAEITTTEAVTLLTGARHLGVDVETTGFPIGHRDYALRTVQLGTADWCVYLDPDDGDQAGTICWALDRATDLYAYSATADLGPIAAAGLGDHDVLWGKMHDIAPLAVIAAPMGGQFDSDLGLKANATRYLADPVAPAAERAKDALFTAGKWLKKLKLDTPVDRSGWANAPKDSEVMARYGASDVLDTMKLAQVVPDPGETVRERERAIGRVVAPVSYRGIRLDVDRVEQLATEHRTRRAELGEQIRDVMKIDNPNSSRQVAGWLTTQGVTLPKTDAGNDSVKADVVAGLVRDPAVPEHARSVLGAYGEYVKIGKRLDAFLTPWYATATRGDGRLRPIIYTLGAEKTGRMSAVRPNMQQVPSEGTYRDCILADDGHLWVGADFGSVEIRFGAILSGDPALKERLIAGLDVHAVIAEQVYGPGFTKAQRTKVKSGVYGWLYGGGMATLAHQIEGTVRDAEAMVATLCSVAPGLAQWVYAVRDAVKAGQLRHYTTYAGRVIHIGAAHSAPNYLIQGSAREALGDGLIKLESTEYKGSVILPVHDEILMHVPEDRAEHATATLQECMEQTMEGVHIVVETAKPSQRWPVH